MGMVCTNVAVGCKGKGLSLSSTSAPVDVELTSGDETTSKICIPSMGPQDQIRTQRCYISPSVSSKKQMEFF